MGTDSTAVRSSAHEQVSRYKRNRKKKEEIDKEVALRMKEKAKSVEEEGELSHLGDGKNGNNFWRLWSVDMILGKMMRFLCAVVGLKQQQCNQTAALRHTVCDTVERAQL